jgi:PAS domain S-box-containing protein
VLNEATSVQGDTGARGQDEGASTLLAPARPARGRLFFAVIVVLLSLAAFNIVALVVNQRSEDAVRNEATPRLLSAQELELSLAELNSAQNLGAADPSQRSEFNVWRGRVRRSLAKMATAQNGPVEHAYMASIVRDYTLFLRVDHQAQQALAAGHPKVSQHLVVDTDTGVYRMISSAAQGLVDDAADQHAAAVDRVDQTRKISVLGSVLLGLIALGLVAWLLVDYRGQRRLLQTTASGYRSLVDQMPAAVYTVAPGGQLNYVSPQITEILGYTQKEWLAFYDEGGARVPVHPDDQALVDDLTRSYLAGGTDRYEVEVRMRHKDRSYRDVVVASAPFDAGGGQIGRQGVILDRTASREMEAKYHRIAKQLPAAIIIWDIVQGEVVDATDQLELLTGEPVAGWIGPAGFDRWTSRIVNETASTPDWRDRARRGETWTNEYQWRRPDGGVIWVWTINASVSDRPGRVQSIFYDITREVQTRRELQEAERRRRAALEQLISTAEAERARIASELHDDTVQMMVAALMRLGMTDDPMAKSAGELLQVAIDRTRTMMFELRPQILERNGLAEALRELAREGPWEARVDVQVGRYTELTEALCYRAIRELVVNARKHSRAGVLTITGHEQDQRWLVFTVEDDGIGFDMAAEQSKPSAKYHIGLDSTIERIGLAGGSLTITSAPGHGTRCVLRVPYDPELQPPQPAVEGSTHR